MNSKCGGTVGRIKLAYRIPYFALVAHICRKRDSPSAEFHNRVQNALAAQRIVIENPYSCTLPCKPKRYSTPYSVSRARHHSSSSVKSTHDILFPFSFPYPYLRNAPAILPRSRAICRHAMTFLLKCPGTLADTSLIGLNFR